VSRHKSSSHPLLKAAVVIGGVVLAVFVVMSLVSAVIGAAWTIIEIVLAVGVVSGLWHMIRRHHQVATQGKRDELARHGT
jgi:F0F1-type ATP synthase assembly protein I